MRTDLVLSLVVLGALAGTARGQVAVCGNHVLEPPELCDDGNLVDGDGCDSNCTPTGCGNGIVTAGEQCDDGNLVSGDCCSATCQLEPNLPPDCSQAAPSVAELWPPNHSMVPVGIDGITDPDGDPVVITVTAIAQDEPLDATGDGATCPDGEGVGIDTASLRSERSGHGDGRVYHVAFQAADRCNAVCTGSVEVCVRHDQGAHGACGDGGPLFDSTAGAPPCQGDACGPEDCVPDPGEIDACHGDDVPHAVTAPLAKARDLLSHGKGRKRGRAAAKQLAKAARRADRAATRGRLGSDCAAALAAAVDEAGPCATCRE
jgi:cysteine-rich repeat protein